MVQLVALYKVFQKFITNNTSIPQKIKNISNFDSLFISFCCIPIFSMIIYHIIDNLSNCKSLTEEEALRGDLRG